MSKNINNRKNGELLLIRTTEMETMFKPRMTYEEMYAAFTEAHPGLDANHRSVGAFAKKMGYKRYQQMSNGVITKFYYKD